MGQTLAPRCAELFLEDAGGRRGRREVADPRPRGRDVVVEVDELRLP
jgi:hypothetical protein